MLRITFALLGLGIGYVVGHGMLLDPPNRSSLWRFDDSYPPNYNDNENYCGGIAAQWQIHEGKCGVCGDEYGLPHPQRNEHTGEFGLGKIVATYKSGQIVETATLLTANHLGHFEFSLCEITDEDAPESGEDCFKPLYLSDGRSQFPITENDFRVINRIQLPTGYTCDHCVLRWQYRGGNNWGECEDGSWGMGCGEQETFRSCSDIKIV